MSEQTATRLTLISAIGGVIMIVALTDEHVDYTGALYALWLSVIFACGFVIGYCWGAA